MNVNPLVPWHTITNSFPCLVQTHSAFSCLVVPCEGLGIAAYFNFLAVKPDHVGLRSNERSSSWQHWSTWKKKQEINMICLLFGSRHILQLAAAVCVPSTAKIRWQEISEMIPSHERSVFSFWVVDQFIDRNPRSAGSLWSEAASAILDLYYRWVKTTLRPAQKR